MNDDERETVYEDLGYRRDGAMADHDKAVDRMKRTKPRLKKIQYVKGCMVGKTANIFEAIADDLIRRGYAEAFDREPGEDG